MALKETEIYFFLKGELQCSLNAQPHTEWFLGRFSYIPLKCSGPCTHLGTPIKLWQQAKKDLSRLPCPFYVIHKGGELKGCRIYAQGLIGFLIKYLSSPY